MSRSDRMISYAAFGLRLDSDLELPELDEVESLVAPTWRIVVGSTDDCSDRGSLLGADSVYGAVQVRAYATPGAYRLVFDDTGTFEINPKKRTISWYPGPGATEAAVRADLLGRVIAFAAHSDGCLALHASAVCIDGHAIAFVGAKGAGKSTLALALVQAGARLMTDDTLIVRLDEQRVPWAAPGVQRVRLWEDSARALGAAASHGAGPKPTVDALPPNRRQQVEAPLVTCYVIRPAAVDSHVVRRERLSPVHAAVACVSFSKLGSLAGGTEAAATLDRCAGLAGAVPVYAVDVARDLRRLDDAAAELLAWHHRIAPNAARAG